MIEIRDIKETVTTIKITKKVGVYLGEDEITCLIGIACFGLRHKTELDTEVPEEKRLILMLKTAQMKLENANNSDVVSTVTGRDSNVCKMCKCPERGHYNYCPSFAPDRCSSD